jgi:hypothetical protein
MRSGVNKFITSSLSSEGDFNTVLWKSPYDNDSDERLNGELELEKQLSFGPWTSSVHSVIDDEESQKTG